MNQLQLVISDIAQEDLMEIWGFISLDDDERADLMLDLLYEKCTLLSKMPGVGTSRDELITGLYSFPVKRYVIYYRVKSTTLEIVRILSSYRDIDSIF